MDSFDTASHSPHLRILSDDQIRNIYRATLACLQRTGVEVRNQEARQLLHDAGAKIEGHRVRIPSQIIESTLADTPKAFTIFGQKQKWNMSIDDITTEMFTEFSAESYVSWKKVEGGPGKGEETSSNLPEQILEKLRRFK